MGDIVWGTRKGWSSLTRLLCHPGIVTHPLVTGVTTSGNDFVLRSREDENKKDRLTTRHGFIDTVVVKGEVGT
ncbi:hypothetical protein CEXT_459921 [Caerostris extrusa]|uniref:Uncharacterized protein n=1 Tax=Caerostris extrusa TaxID=172846 RepID=A0AAV4X5A2_CAEEX|nr:hypothetical protein CEXT_459921 [Caerostris extrusa]